MAKKSGESSHEEYLSMPMCVAVLLALCLTGCGTTGHSKIVRSDIARFKSHRFTAECGNTYACTVAYANYMQRDGGELSPPLRDDVLRRTKSARIGIRNFPRPAFITWRSKDRKELRAEIDMALIFKDEIAIHRVPIWEISGVNTNPTIVLIVDDRTIRVYMKTWVWINHQGPKFGSRGDFREEAVLAFEREY